MSEFSLPHVQPALVELAHVTKRFGGVIALDAVSFKVRPGTYCCLLGPSGCGKSTALRIIAGHEEPDSGEIVIGPRTVNSARPGFRGAAMMFQSYALFPHLSALENVGFPLKARGVSKAERRKRAADLLALVDLTGFEDRLPAALSGGQQQRVALARALIAKPSALLLDEPLSALDPYLRVRVGRELKRLQQELGISFIQVTHSQDEAMAFADQIIVLDRGRVVQSGSPEEIFRHPRTAFVARFLGGYSVLRGTMLESVGTVGLVLIGGERIVVPGARLAHGSPIEFAVRADAVQAARSRAAPRAVRAMAPSGAPGPALAADAPPLMNSITGPVIATEFRGAHYEITIAVDGGGELSAILEAADESRPEPGEMLTLNWLPEACLVLETT